MFLSTSSAVATVPTEFQKPDRSGINMARSAREEQNEFQARSENFAAAERVITNYLKLISGFVT